MILDPFISLYICQEAFDKLIQSFISHDIMAYPKDSGHLALDTRACDSTIGAVPYM
jgi:hypothetical protein